MPKDDKKKQDPLALGMLGEAFLKVSGMEAKIDAFAKIVEGNGKETLIVRIDRMERTLERYLRARDHTRRELALALGLILSLIMQLLGN